MSDFCPSREGLSFFAQEIQQGSGEVIRTAEAYVVVVQVGARELLGESSDIRVLSAKAGPE